MSDQIIRGSLFASKFARSVSFVGIPSQGAKQPKGGNPSVNSSTKATKADNKNPLSHQGTGFTFQQQRAKARKGVNR